MEDAHISMAPFPKKDNDSQTALFGVFDGHGGSFISFIKGAEVAAFVERHFA